MAMRQQTSLYETPRFKNFLAIKRRKDGIYAFHPKLWKERKKRGMIEIGKNK